MIARIVALGIVTETGRRPTIGRMTNVALNRRCQVRGWFEGGATTAAVTVIATTDAGLIVRPRTADKSCGGMTKIAIQRSFDVVGIHARRGCAVVTRGTIVHDTRMVEVGRGESAGSVANTAILIGGQVISAFGRGVARIVARRAVIYDTDMIKRCRQKAGGLVTVDAISVGWDVIAALSDYRRSIVTGAAVVDYALMIKVGLGERSRDMADRTIIVCRDMLRIDFGVLAGCIHAVVARSAVAGNASVVERRRSKSAASRVAHTAILIRDHMRRIDLGVLTRCIYTIVTRVATGAQHFWAGVIDKCIRKAGCIVAG